MVTRRGAERVRKGTSQSWARTWTSCDSLAKLWSCVGGLPRRLPLRRLPNISSFQTFRSSLRTTTCHRLIRSRRFGCMRSQVRETPSCSVGAHPVMGEGYEDRISVYQREGGDHQRKARVSFGI